ncbi:multiple sugar transport system permease protein/N-acetylglucosamine transport system permease protein [Kribbella aluminosa]|uniref:Multiple sugar transport system permease protein/N-acetylglucosamine transport system permease protein n=1 Tax=Kribbella aluminosa TaxID=416017 RepID=A0ABS4UWU7_9ACTN|nr:carbohydrate ABC transporter permease [Kribbella aluminosa]MBP2356106.1 multiple sugar transport system permease protein/N-acetylglucosamine transport system permease protein [Kribbella aluminosa]
MTWLIALFSIFVLAWIVLAAFKTTDEIFSSPLRLPAVWRWQNFIAAWNESNFGVAFLNTLGLVIATAAATVLLAAPAAYALSRFHVRGSRFITAGFAIGLGIPVQLVVLPLYSALSSVGLVNNFVGLWLIYVATSMPFAVFFLTAFFGSLPREIEEAASLDGASPVRTFWTVMLPLARSGIVTLVILNVIAHWSETTFALVFMQTTVNETLPLALLKFLQRLQYTGADWGQLFAGVVIVLLPILIIYVWLGRRIIEGLTLGAGK